jgi:hypothetical protein
MRSFYGLIAVLVIATPLGLLATGTAYGEWGGSELAQRIGYVPRGLARLGDLWAGVLPDYGQSNATGAFGVIMYVVSALIGLALLIGIAWLLVRVARRRGGAKTAVGPKEKASKA